MKGQFVDSIRFSIKKKKVNSAAWQSNIALLKTDYGTLRVLDTKGDKPVIINAPDGPNIIEHQKELITALAKNFRVICFEFPGIGFSYPSSRFDYSVENGANTILNLMDILKIENATLSLSCSNGFYAIKAAQLAPEKFIHLFLSQTPSNSSMLDWVNENIPKPLTYPIIGELINSVSEKKLTTNWYKRAYPKGRDNTSVENIAYHALDNGGCFCLSGLVQGLNKDILDILKVLDVPSTLVWGNKDYSHRHTDCNTITEHLPNCKVVAFSACGHFPELENTEKYVSLVNETLGIQTTIYE